MLLIDFLVLGFLILIAVCIWVYVENRSDGENKWCPRCSWSRLISFSIMGLHWWECPTCGDQFDEDE